MTIHQDGAIVDVVETHQQLDHGGLPGAGRTDDGDLLTGFSIEGKVVDDDLIRAVAEVDILEIHTTFNISYRNGILGVGNFLRFSQEFEHALSRSHRLLKNIGDLGDLRDGLGERADILDKGLDITNRHCALTAR